MKAQIERIQKDIEIINNFNATPEKGINRLEDIGLGCEVLLATVVALATS